MKNIKIILSLLALFVLERVIFARFQIFSLTPWLGFSFCLIGGAVGNDKKTAIVTALIYGLISDLTGTSITGSAMISFAFSVYIVQIAVLRIFKNSFFVSALAVFIASIFGELLYYLLNFSGIDISIGGLLWSFVLPLSLINTLFATVLYYPARWIFTGRSAI